MSKYLIVFCFLITGCSVAGIKNYDPYYKNTQQLEGVKGTFDSVVVAGANPELDQVLAKKSLSCRLTSFSMPAGKNLGDYIRDALTSELEAAKKLSANGDSIEITVNKLESSTSSMDKGSWTVDFTYKTPKGKMTIETKTVFESAFVADTACRNTAYALQDALRENFNMYFVKSSPGKSGRKQQKSVRTV